MSLFARFLHPPLPVTTHRAYSSFFSSKPGGGRYFNSSKPPKSIEKGEGGAGKKSNGKINADDNSSTPPSLSTHEVAAQAQSATSPPHLSQTKMPFTSGYTVLPVHPSVNAQDFKLHQFFSLHRPLLSLDHPASDIFAPSPPSHPLFASSTTTANSRATQAPLTLDNPPEATQEADEDAARVLARALVLNRVGGAIAWEDTLRRLGVDVDEGRVELSKELEKEWNDIYMDSTKRKRRKKMKKHKLKKRRKLTRATRLKIGR
ncbi:hypothetical protein PLICRDRAFT_53618 [Plicaturopsis crispa FD-325 SS-3]|nr:hypothetical protein PLICRDRAFT_53618 [Plicaturopsis crispa FD-325 SS-3]